MTDVSTNELHWGILVWDIYIPSHDQTSTCIRFLLAFEIVKWPPFETNGEWGWLIN